MTGADPITDPQLCSALDAAAACRDQCFALIDQLAQCAGTTITDLPREKQLEISQQQKLLNSHLAQVRATNRVAARGVRETKLKTDEARSEVDRLHLQLQNPYYEQRHLQGEIQACESYDHKYQSLPLITVEQFLELFPEHHESDENTLMVARIEHEHSERQTLEEKRQGLLKLKQGLIAKNKKRKEDLANLDKNLENFHKAAEPIKEIFRQESE